MKKNITLVTCAAMVAALAVPSLAAATAPESSPTSGKGAGGYSIGVSGNFVAGTVAEVISVDVARKSD